MKNFSLKALGATLIAAALVVCGAAIPASAGVAVSWTTSAPTFSSGNTPAMSLDFTPSNLAATFDKVIITVKDSNNQSMSLANIISGSLANCKLVSLSGADVSTWNNSCSRVQGGPAPYPYESFDVQNASAGGFGTAKGSFTLSVMTGIATGLQSGQTYQIVVGTASGANINETASLTVSVPAAGGGGGGNVAYFRPNGAPGLTSSMSASGSSLTLPPNSFTYSGYTFTGWRLSDPTNGTLYQPGDSVTVSGTATFYAQWSNGSASVSTSSSDTLASTGFDAQPYLLLGNLLGVLGVAVLLIGARRRQTS